ncbi:hypothetical protein [Arundinibacter roseus]|uniref:ParB/Sulfiredoxin domain-containing protein n=1 Tax=Arundinibacter roseus TaxID=2070510 RepID=A0A4R4K0N2_9BACT|nr:hypothetical protein [Arundinibacter roseus]TDB59519.1 hypothetical protein EZE20_22195 [Arundinibacter roseus]
MAKTRALDKLKEKTADLKPTVFTQQVYIKENLIVLPELRNLIPALQQEEFQQLESNLLAHGIKDPLTIWETTSSTVAAGLSADSPSHELLSGLNTANKVYVLIDGHNRYDLASAHQLDYRINIVDFEDLEKVRDYMIDFQLGRRNLTPEQASYLRGLRYNKLKEGNRSDRINVAQQLAEEYNVSTRTIKRDADYAKGVDSLSPGLKNEVLAGKAKLPKTAAKVLSRDKPGKPIESLEELNNFLEKQPRSLPGLDDLHEQSENSKDEESRHMDVLIKDAVQEELSKGKDPVGGKAPSMVEATQALRIDLKALVEKDLSQKEVLYEIINKAKSLLERMD